MTEHKGSLNDIRFFKHENKCDVMVSKSYTAVRSTIAALGGHFPVLLKLRDNVLMIVFRTGDFHMGMRGTLSTVFSVDEGHAWSRPIIVADEDTDLRNPCLIQTHSGKVILVYTSLRGYDTTGKFCHEQESCELYATFTRDYFHWTAPIMIDTAGLRGSAYGRMIEMPDRSVLLPFHGKRANKTEYESWIYASTDEGLRFSPLTCIAKGFSETSLLYLPSGKVIAMLRRDPEDELWLSESSNLKTWSEPKQILKKNLVPADLIYLAESKTVVLTYGYRLPPYGIRAVISKDEGRTWLCDKEIVLAADARSWDCGYPTSVQLDGDTVFSAYYSAGGNIETCEYERGAVLNGIRYNIAELI